MKTIYINEVPPITHELGKHWEQPPTTDIIIDDNFCVMDEKTFNKLATYNTSKPTGIYEGKMWKRYANYPPPLRPRWYLCWYGFSDKPGMCSNNQREILIFS